MTIPDLYRWAAQAGIDHAREKNGKQKSPFKPGSFADRIYRRSIMFKDSNPDRRDEDIIKEVYELYRNDEQRRSKV